MKKMSFSLLAAAAMATAGLAQADAIFYPDGTVVELGDSSTETIALSSDNSLSTDTTVLGAGPATTSVTTTTTTKTVPVVQYTYVQPNINWDRSVALSQVRGNPHLSTHAARMDNQARHQAAATFNVPARAGEASTMTGGAPNVSTDNQLLVGSYTIPYNVVSVDGPYYVFSY